MSNKKKKISKRVSSKSFTCNTKKLADAFRLASSVAPKTSLKPILLCAKMSVSESKLTLEATDLELFVKTKVSIESTWSGTVTVSASKMSSILQTITDEEVRIDIEESSLLLTCKNGFYRLLIENAENFPPVPEVKSPAIKIDGDVLTDLLNKITPSVAEDKSRYSINGVYLSIKGRRLTAAATDGKQLSVAEGDIENNTETWSGIVPSEGIRLLKCIAKKEVRLLTSQNVLAAKASGTEVYIRLIDGKFPDYKKVIPTENNRKLTVNRQELLTAIENVSILCYGDSREIRFSFTKNKLNLSSRTQDVGEAELSMKVSWNSPEMEIGFAPHLLADALRVLGSEEITLELKDGESALMIREGKGYTYVLMPLSK